MTTVAKGFSLIELLVVIGIMAVLLGLAVPAISATLESNNLARAGEIVADQIGLGRQMASTRNVGVEVRFIRISPRTPAGFSAVQIWTIDARGESLPVGKVVMLPDAIVVSDSSAISPLFSVSPSVAGSMPSGPLAGSAYGGVRLGPSGAVSPPPALPDRKRLYVSLVNDRFASSSVVPANYVTVQVNPDTGSTEIYRP